MGCRRLNSFVSGWCAAFAISMASNDYTVGCAIAVACSALNGWFAVR
jgi:hypothetical protein